MPGGDSMKVEMRDVIKWLRKEERYYADLADRLRKQISEANDDELLKSKLKDQLLFTVAQRVTLGNAAERIDLDLNYGLGGSDDYA